MAACLASSVQARATRVFKGLPKVTVVTLVVVPEVVNRC
jgi:hypothetical protein